MKGTALSLCLSLLLIGVLAHYEHEDSVIPEEPETVQLQELKRALKVLAVQDAQGVSRLVTVVGEKPFFRAAQAGSTWYPFDHISGGNILMIRNELKNLADARTQMGPAAIQKLAEAFFENQMYFTGANQKELAALAAGVADAIKTGSLLTTWGAMGEDRHEWAISRSLGGSAWETALGKIGKTAFADYLIEVKEADITAALANPWLDGVDQWLVEHGAKLVKPVAAPRRVPKPAVTSPPAAASTPAVTSTPAAAQSKPKFHELPVAVYADRYLGDIEMLVVQRRPFFKSNLGRRAGLWLPFHGFEAENGRLLKSESPLDGLVTSEPGHLERALQFFLQLAPYSPQTELKALVTKEFQAGTLVAKFRGFTDNPSDWGISITLGGPLWTKAGSDLGFFLAQNLGASKVAPAPIAEARLNDPSEANTWLQQHWATLTIPIVVTSNGAEKVAPQYPSSESPSVEHVAGAVRGYQSHEGSITYFTVLKQKPFFQGKRGWMPFKSLLRTGFFHERNALVQDRLNVNRQADFFHSVLPRARWHDILQVVEQNREFTIHDWGFMGDNAEQWGISKALGGEMWRTPLGKFFGEYVPNFQVTLDQSESGKNFQVFYGANTWMRKWNAVLELPQNWALDKREPAAATQPLSERPPPATGQAMKRKPQVLPSVTAIEYYISTSGTKRAVCVVNGKAFFQNPSKYGPATDGVWFPFEGLTAYQLNLVTSRLNWGSAYMPFDSVLEYFNGMFPAAATNPEFKLLLKGYGTKLIQDFMQFGDVQEHWAISAAFGGPLWNTDLGKFLIRYLPLYQLQILPTAWPDSKSSAPDWSSINRWLVDHGAKLHLPSQIRETETPFQKAESNGPPIHAGPVDSGFRERLPREIPVRVPAKAYPSPSQVQRPAVPVAAVAPPIKGHDPRHVLRYVDGNKDIRFCAVLDQIIGVPFMLSPATAQNADFKFGNWYPFKAFRGEAYNKFDSELSNLWYDAENYRQVLQFFKTMLYAAPATEVQTEVKKWWDADGPGLLSTFGRLGGDPELWAISAAVGGSLWETDLGRLVKRYIQPKYERIVIHQSVLNEATNMDRTKQSAEEFNEWLHRNGALIRGLDQGLRDFDRVLFSKLAHWHKRILAVLGGKPFYQSTGATYVSGTDRTQTWFPCFGISSDGNKLVKDQNVLGDLIYGERGEKRNAQNFFKGLLQGRRLSGSQSRRLDELVAKEFNDEKLIENWARMSDDLKFWSISAKLGGGVWDTDLGKFLSPLLDQQYEIRLDTISAATSPSDPNNWLRAQGGRFNHPYQ